MAKGGEKKNVIIVKKGHGDHGHHGGAWKVAYADFVTAMMAFFLVMWLVTQSEEVRAGLAGYFRDPVAFTGEARTGLLTGGAGLLMPDTEPRPPDLRNVEEEVARQKLRDVANTIVESIREMPGYRNLAKQIELQLTEDGLRIQLIEGDQATFFDVGSSRLSENGTDVLGRIGGIIGPLGFKVMVEGHTDARPYPRTASGYTNWELSADRANSARKVLLASGVPEDQVWGIRGFADRLPRYVEDAFDPRNRRIAVVVMTPGAEQAVQQRENMTPTSLDELGAGFPGADGGAPAATDGGALATTDAGPPADAGPAIVDPDAGAAGDGAAAAASGSPEGGVGAAEP